ncbi:phenylpyruvate tautomerase PptA (4-oxalocrotonate tautomerase family) [Kineococcus radiotolerans]|uniref:Phenylpyruvate tautomerase PptA (4-oxalocrotonate tautomerase family) n=1 Tax=Kineococcus radiotolerans TaxID=131568 RepID=A0A7W4TQS7_KINRA|nr:hypothetical protein [Kineococcus radiotolerans]MBB2903374.1 phenylpyruvate tautomerase PptA (4-oxalocrotonate tautomerase family) [Kineococcus radiotolerans]
MPWINLTLRKGALNKTQQHEVMARLTSALMWWEKIPDTPAARKVMKGWVYEVEADADYHGGRPEHEAPFYFLEVRIPAHRLSELDKRGIMHDFTQIVLDGEGTALTLEDAGRVWVTIFEIEEQDWGIGGHTDWLRAYTSALTPEGRAGRAS